MNNLKEVAGYEMYLPDDIKDSKYYIYQDNKFEQTLKEYWDKVKK